MATDKLEKQTNQKLDIEKIANFTMNEKMWKIYKVTSDNAREGKPVEEKVIILLRKNDCTTAV